MTTGARERTAVTVIIGQHVRAGHASAFADWQDRMNEAAAAFPGFLGAEVTPPTAVQPDWVTVYRFDSVVHVRNWLNSATRQDLLDEGAGYADGPATQQVLTRADQPALVTVVVTHRVAEEDTAAFLAWQERMTAAERGFPGFRGAEIFRPVDGVQDEWTAVYGRGCRPVSAAGGSLLILAGVSAPPATPARRRPQLQQGL